jgi:hypothetical protein
MYIMENKQIRQINIDPKFLEITNNGGGTKRKQSTGEKAIRVREPTKPRDHNKTTKRNALLKFIRRHQSKNAQQLLEGNDALTNMNVITNLPKNEIDETLEYLMGVADEVKKKEPQPGLDTSLASYGNYTLKHDYKSNSGLGHRSTPEGYMGKSNENVSMNFPNSSGDLRSPSELVVRRHSALLPDHMLKPEPSNIVLNHRHLVGGEHPQYGCLRSGELPTYRQLQKQKQQTYFPKGWQGGTNTIGQRTGSLRTGAEGSQIQPTRQEALLPERDDYIFGEGGNVKHSAESSTKSSEKDPANIQLKIMRQRRTSRRTFKIGKSKTRPKVGVLISNRTIRKNIATNALLLKQVPMTEIRRYLVKHNLITVGSNAPDYVLRKMYETSNTVCGEIFNHNNENLLHNFFHGKDEV